MSRIFRLRLDRMGILLVILLAFGLRVEYLSLFSFHIDEFYTLAASSLIAETGLPRYPTGLFYDPGLPYSYLSGLLFWLLGFDEALGRWPAVLFGTLAVAMVYWLGRHILRSPWVGLLAALWLALSEESLTWSGRARAISLAQFLVLAATALLWLGLTRPSSRARLLMAGSYALALLAHFSVVVLLPAWGMATVVLWRLKGFRIDKVFWRDSILAGLFFGVALSSGVFFQPPPSVDFQMAEAGLIAKFLTLLNKFLQAPPNLAAAGPEYFWYFAEWPHGPLITLALIGLGLSLVQSWRGRAGDQEADQEAQRDWGGTFLGVIFLTSLFVLIFLINEHWQRTRYLVMQAQALFLLLAAHGLQVCLDLVSNFWRKQPLLTGGLALGLSLGLTWPFIQPLSRVMDAGYLGWDRYDLAFEEVAKTWAEAESDSDLGGVKPARLVGTMHPPAAWLYLKQNDYYLVQSSPKLILKPDGSVGDRYTGAALLESAAALDQVLDQEADLWLVIQEFWLFNSYDGLLQQEILWRMDKIWGEGGVWALASRPGTWPLAREMATPLEAEFETGTRLLGFTARPATISPGGVIQLTLFWHGETIPFQKKVFVQVRNAANETVSQADHFIYDGKVPSSRWDDLLENDWAIRDGATLVLPPDLPPGEYRIIVGFYDSQTFARLGVINDQSGESGVVLGTWMVE